MIALDTNILVYAVGTHDKAPAARTIVKRAALSGAILPLQVIAEFANVCRRKRILNVAGVRARISEFADGFTTVPTAERHIDAAITIADRYQLPFFDSLICEVARDFGAATLLSEDFHDGISLSGFTILNPFNAANAGRIDALLAF